MGLPSDLGGASFWAKTGDAGFKSVPQHLADVAAAALLYLELNPTRLRREAQLNGMSAEVHAQLCAVLAALHDLGKISRGFQSLAPEFWPSGVLDSLPKEVQRSLSHWEATALLLNAAEVKKALAPIFGQVDIDPQVIAAVSGHHGRAPRGDLASAREGDASRHGEIGPECVQIAASLCAELVALFPTLRGISFPAQLAGFSFSLNGLITLADWVGSDEQFFPFGDPQIPLAEYWCSALTMAREALAAKGLLPAIPADELTLAGLSGLSASARPMQQAVINLTVSAEPQLHIIEDGTGSGKTEAALLLAHRLIRKGLGEGLLIALPTMATANAMHSRLSRAMSAMFEGRASLILAHGKASTSQALARISSREANTKDSATAAWFNAWISDTRKKAFFADAGAGTIDQAFLAVLPKKHLTMRQYALSGRILIIDEAHACDAYMGEELKALLEMHAMLGGSAIILSATLGKSARAELVQAFARGRGMHPRDIGKLGAGLHADAYPLLTSWCAPSGLREGAVKADPALSRSVAVSRLSSRADTVALAMKLAQQGAAVAIICNAVDAAADTWRDLLAAGQEPERCHLFHARFLMDDRLAIEERVQTWFGRHSTADQRSGRILVATQVIEQSLDVDFDVMISDLAPVDLLIQRAGRLWRHKREVRPVPSPVLHVLSPDPAKADTKNWLHETLGPGAHVYDLPGVMWRSARELFSRGRIETPGDLRSLIETVYAQTVDDLPDVLQSLHLAALGQNWGRAAMGKHNTIEPSEGYLALSSLSADEEIGTRLGEASVTIRLARRENDRLVPFARRPGANEGLNWALSEIAVRKGWLLRLNNGNLPEPLEPDLVETARALWPEWERGMILYEVGAGRDLQTSSHRTLIYSSEQGLCVV